MFVCTAKREILCYGWKGCIVVSYSKWDIVIFLVSHVSHYVMSLNSNLRLGRFWMKWRTVSKVILGPTSVSWLVVIWFGWFCHLFRFLTYGVCFYFVFSFYFHFKMMKRKCVFNDVLQNENTNSLRNILVIAQCFVSNAGLSFQLHMQERMALFST